MYKAVLADGKGAKAAPKAAHAEDEKPLSEKKHAEHKRVQTTDKLAFLDGNNRKALQN